jgi:hypothetical protein
MEGNEQRTVWMNDKKPPSGARNEELIKAFDRERAEARELNRRHAEEARKARSRDRQVLIERRRHPR